MRLILAFALTLAPNYTPVDVWESDWQSRVEVEHLTTPMLTEWQRIHDLYPWWTPAPPEVEPHRGMGSGVEQWRNLVERYFGANTDRALGVMACESGGNPNATHPGSQASGLFQAMPQWYTGRGWDRPSPFGAFDPYDPDRNIAFAAWLSGGGASWSHWVCKP